ncbi:MAG: hypothetical protein ACREDM_17060 [Methylocella sp.]
MREFIAVSTAKKSPVEAADRLPPSLIFGGKGGRLFPLGRSPNAASTGKGGR